MPVDETSRPAGPAASVDAPPPSRRLRAAGLAMLFGPAALALTVLVHLVKPEVSTAWQTTSEYAIGRHGWVMALAFVVTGLSYAALAVAVSGLGRRGAVRVAVVLLVLAAAGTCIGGLFVTDPIETPQSELSTSGTLHGLGAGLALVLVPVAALLLNLGLVRTATGRRRTVLRFAAVLPALALVAFMVTQGVLTAANGGALGPGAPIGGVERLLLVAYAVWLVLTARAVRTAHLPATAV